MKKKQRKPTHLTITKHYGPEVSTINQGHYTSYGEHPEDRIFSDKEFINRLQSHVDLVYGLLANDLRLNEKGKDWLFDYIYNCDEPIEFEEYLERFDVKYRELVK